MHDEWPDKLSIRWTYKGTTMAITPVGEKEPRYFTGTHKECVKELQKKGYRIYDSKTWIKK